MGKPRIKLEGTQINNWYIEEYVGELKYRCTCKCGNSEIVSGKNIRYGISTRCRDCYNKERQDKYIGMVFGNWEVIKYAGDKKQLCKCLKCGREVEVYTESLVSGRSNQCTHCKSSHNKSIGILEGQYFGKWYVQKYLGKDTYRCICSCGEPRDIIGNNLKIGHTTQCKKCSGKEFIDMQDKTIGELKVIDYVSDGKWRCMCSCGREELIHGYFLRKEKVSMCKACRDNGNASSPEKEILKIFNKAIPRDRTILKDREIDIYIPDKNIGIEFNGNYWHSSKYKDKKYHYNKTIELLNKGIRLIHIFEYEWNDIRVQSILKNMLYNINEDKRQKLFARNLVVKSVDKNTKKQFLLNNHLQGDSTSTSNYGLYNKDNELLAIMTFGTPRFDKTENTYELIRYCTRLDTVIVGGASKLFKHFCRKELTVKKVISYCDISKFTGKVYKELGFKKVAITEPNYVWVKGNKVLKRYQTQKYELVKNGLGTEDQTEDEIMSNQGFLKLYDCGNLKYEYILNTDNH